MLVFLRETAINTVTLPTRPTYMSSSTSAFDRGSRSRVMPVDSPTVPMAEMHSKNTSFISISCCTAKITKLTDSIRLK